uniref:DUF1343 domain-containing protein n=1 Tax=candidate division WOR-3 bacterium TaxID=2052148 RepID=A0A7V3KN53_UNCW3
MGRRNFVRTRLGIDRIGEEWPKELKGAKVALLVHQASVNSNLRYTWDVFSHFDKVKVKALLAPQHGLFGETQDNMIEWEDFRDPSTGLPVYSLYGKSRKPLPYMLEGIDGIVVDLQDVGTRYYTYIWTLYLVMESALENGKFVVVLDRPNPIGGLEVEGPVLKEAYSSFVGLKPLPVRHGMTIGEIALLFKGEYLRDINLFVLKMENWSRNYFWEDTGLEWVNPSPNMPSEKTALLYPGICLLEATNISEGRGTTRPFEILGAPFINPYELVEALENYSLEGVYFRPLYFIPTFNKFAGEECGGLQIHITDKKALKPFKIGVVIIKVIKELYPDHFRWREPPYEYEFKKLPIDILAGSNHLREALDRGDSIEEIEAWWKLEGEVFNKKVRSKYLIYE